MASLTHRSSGSARGADGRLVRKTAVEMVADEIRQRILCGQIAPGSALRQEALAEGLGVSRIPLREAIRLLSAEGLVDLLPHKGAYVSMLSLGAVREFFDLRLRLEPWLFHEAALRTSAEELDRAQALVQRMDTVDAAEWGRMNWQLHELLYRAADRPLALDIVHALHERSERYFRFQLVIASIRKQAHGEHMNLISLCRRRKPAQARDAMSHHIAEAAEQILAIVSRLLEPSRPHEPQA